jgi:anhydro-N-acetylmuramic acid kinase
VSDELLIGLRSNTARAGVDAVLVNFYSGSMDILHASFTPYPPAIRQTLEQLTKPDRHPDGGVTTLLDDNLGRFYARAAQNLVREAGLEMRDVTAIGVHGPSARQDPDGDTVHLGNPVLLARGTKTTVVAGFKAGVRGAALAPLLHRHLFYCSTESRAVVALGATARLTLLPISGEVSAFVCGPGTCLMDGWTRRHLHKESDIKGNWASKGVVDAGLLQKLLNDDYFSLGVCARTGPGHFTMDWLDKHLQGSGLPPGTVQTTLAELTAASIANGINTDTMPKRLLVCGPGVNNDYLRRRIAAALPDTTVEPTTRHGADPDWMDGLLFAWLARQRLAQKPQDTRTVGGAAQPELPGEIFEPPG